MLSGKCTWSRKHAAQLRAVFRFFTSQWPSASGDDDANSTRVDRAQSFRGGPRFRTLRIRCQSLDSSVDNWWFVISAVYANSFCLSLCCLFFLTFRYVCVGWHSYSFFTWGWRTHGTISSMATLSSGTLSEWPYLAVLREDTIIG